MLDHVATIVSFKHSRGAVHGRAHVSEAKALGGLGGTDVAASDVLQLQPSAISFAESIHEIA